MVRVSVAVPLAALIALAGCKTTNMADGVESAGSAVADGARGVAASLVNVNLSNVLNDILHIEQASDRQLRQAVEAFMSTEKAAA